MIDIIIPVYNAERFLKRCVDSILMQTNPTWNLILVDDGSIDNSGNLCDFYAEKYSNFNVLLTGGDMPFFVPHIKSKIFADPYLMYKGLYAISKNNR